MCIQGTWADALIIQAVADILLFTQFRKEILPLQSDLINKVSTHFIGKS